MSTVPAPKPEQALTSRGITISSNADATKDDGKPKVYTVLEIAGNLKIKSAVIAKESAKALFLGDSIMLPTSNQLKRLLIKGHDMIARTEKEAVEQYISYLKSKLIELEESKIKTKEILGTAERFAREFP